MLKLKLQYFDHLMQRADSLEDSDAGKDWGQEEKEAIKDEMFGCPHWLKGHEFEQALEEKDREAWRAADHGAANLDTTMTE